LEGGALIPERACGSRASAAGMVAVKEVSLIGFRVLQLRVTSLV
jgi:hypothetical protein